MRSSAPEGALPSRLVESTARWLDAVDASRALPRFRCVFATIWLAYDVIDATGGWTERSLSWFPHERDGSLLWIQIVLIVTGAMLAAGKGVYVAGLGAAAARAAEAHLFFSLNDFFFVAVVDLLLAHSTGWPFARESDSTRGTPRWVRDALLAELAWIYFATAALKLNPDWLDGRHLFVRTQYLVLTHGWPYPELVAKALASLSFDAALAKVGALFELALGVVLACRRPYALGVALALAVHVTGALLTNVWFFSASMIAAVVLLLPRRMATG